jgi:CheY-like chemotaxis protein
VLRFAVTDSGPGIPQDKMDKLFQSFGQLDASTTRRYGGTGLGLVISKRIVELMAGQIWVESPPGQGATFIFTTRMSVPQIPAVAASGEEPAEPGTLNGRRILLVDDNAVNRKVLQAQTTSWGMKAVVASSPAEGLQLLQDGSHYDLAILDLSMPETDGLGFAQMIRADERSRTLPLILFTSVVPLLARTAGQGAGPELRGGSGEADQVLRAAGSRAPGNRRGKVGDTSSTTLHGQHRCRLFR